MTDTSTDTMNTDRRAGDQREDERDGGLGATGVPGLHTCAIRSVSVRVAGALTTEAFAHHFGTAEQQVGVRAGDTLSYVTGHDVAAAVARVFSDAVAVAERHGLRHSVSATWLGVEPGTYPPALMQRHTTAPATSVGFQPRRSFSGVMVPAHVWVRVGPVLWQVCDRVAADRLAHVWSSCARMLATPRPTPATVRSANASATTARRRAARAAEQPETSVARYESEPGPVRTLTLAEACGDRRSDAELLAGWVAGDRQALAVLAVRCTPLVAESARRVLGSRGEVDDVVQEVWANAASAAAGFEGRSAVSTWLWRLSRNAAINVLRRQRPLVPDASGTCETPAPGDAFGDAEDVITVRQLLAVLPSAQRAAVELVDLQGHDITNAARLLGVAEGTVKSRCQRGRAAMAAEAARRDVTAHD